MISRTLLFGGMIALMAILVGCSQQSPTEPSAGFGTSLPFDKMAEVTSGDSVQFTARVKTRDEVQLMLTFMNCSDTVVAYRNCQIVRLNAAGEAPIPFSGINPGDSVVVNGQRTRSGFAYAHRIAVCASTGFPCDIAIRDTIASIDYAAGTFTVRGRSETIVTDSATILRGTVLHLSNPGQAQTQTRGGSGATCSGPNQNQYQSTDTLLAFTDLAAGDVVEIRANIVDEATLYAVMVKLANCDVAEKKCVEFSATLASIALDSRIVTFDESAVTGYVCPGAKLTGLSGETLTLADFAVGDFVAVKAQFITEDSLKISQMALTTP
jgi:hypothetical protein